jgi:dipeptidase D
MAQLVIRNPLFPFPRPGQEGPSMNSILDREPKLVWKHFDEIRKIPHGSKHEEKIREYIVSFAKKQELEYHVDKAGNVVIRAEATKGMSSKPIVVMQGHMDMVCEKNSDTKHDFTKDPIELQVDGDWLKAKGTTLGADNGVGCAIALAVLEDKTLEHGPLEALFTVDEETGLTGAFALDKSMLHGRLMLNLDSEELGTIYVGCSGGGDSIITLPIKTKSMPSDYETIELKVTGLRGGHSGVDILEQRANAIKVLARVLNAGFKVHKLYISDIKGGNLRNAIPREAFAILGVKTKDKNETIKAFKETAAAILEEFKPVDKDLSLEVKSGKDVTKASKVMGSELTRNIIDMLLAQHHGILSMSLDMPGLVETSCNLAVITIDKEILRIQMSSRSSIKSALQSTRDRIRAVAELAGAKVEEPDSYPGWKPNLKSKLLAITKDAYKEVSGKEPKFKAIHAGLETGIIGERFPGMDMVSIGPEIKYPHSPDEKIQMSTVIELYRVVARVLKKV